MKKIIVALSVSIFTTQFAVAQTPKTPVKKAPASTAKPAAPKPVAANTSGPMKNTMDSLSYAIGMNIAANLKQQNIKCNTDMLASAINHVLNGQPTALDPGAANAYIQGYFQNESMKKAVANQKAGDAFLAANKGKTGIITLPSGLQYQVVKEGTGTKPVATDRVRVHYHGTTIDGTIFDSSVQRGEPAEFGVTQVIQGWQDILQIMPVGSKWKIFIPANLAYGPQGPPSIGPNQVLIFDLELIDIVK
ncbi:FKBP-type peptidyl-prolyl cis-trans isomerase [Emticicia agri]|uniref:Peptidyl-prolyl cis-trans isomerase n=1 Tax=Emticicia agri TaxID=2492393 RepID=A0A4Q5M0J0_9BACT|nr:FKBP-type peptidyl-prolyl cis-trans isomerase [Emticicia agri]RYU95499.1 FKBP-type peptidyl-prolyl cis-trans isomerase [Emticicia agri]